MTDPMTISTIADGLSEALPVPSCRRCEGKGWYWRTPEGFNPFLAGGWNTMRAMYKASCLCSVARAHLEGQTDAG